MRFNPYELTQLPSSSSDEAVQSKLHELIQKEQDPELKKVIESIATAFADESQRSIFKLLTLQHNEVVPLEVSQFLEIYTNDKAVNAESSELPKPALDDVDLSSILKLDIFPQPSIQAILMQFLESLEKPAEPPLPDWKELL